MSIGLALIVWGCWRSSDNPEASLHPRRYDVVHRFCVNCFTSNCGGVPQLFLQEAKDRYGSICGRDASLLVQISNSLHTIEARVDEAGEPGDRRYRRRIGVPAVVLNYSALINRDLDLPLIVSQLTHRRNQLTYAAGDLERHGCSSAGDI